MRSHTSSRECRTRPRSSSEDPPQRGSDPRGSTPGWDQRKEAKCAGQRGGDRAGAVPQRHPAMKRGPWPEENSHTPPTPQSAPSPLHTDAQPGTERPLRREAGSERKRRCSTRAPVPPSGALPPFLECPHRSSDARGAPMRHAPYDDNNIPRGEPSRENARRAPRSAPRRRRPEGGEWPEPLASLRRKVYLSAPPSVKRCLSMSDCRRNCCLLGIAAIIGASYAHHEGLHANGRSGGDLARRRSARAERLSAR